MNASAIPPSRSAPSAELSWGELIDKITILEIKEQRLTSPEAVANVRNELAALKRVVYEFQFEALRLDPLKRKLKSINEIIWDVEDQIRAKEASKSFDPQFIELARAVYHNNDERSRVKREINQLMNSEFVEEKQYTRYTK